MINKTLEKRHQRSNLLVEVVQLVFFFRVYWISYGRTKSSFSLWFGHLFFPITVFVQSRPIFKAVFEA